MSAMSTSDTLDVTRGEGGTAGESEPAATAFGLDSPTQSVESKRDHLRDEADTNMQNVGKAFEAETSPLLQEGERGGAKAGGGSGGEEPGPAEAEGGTFELPKKEAQKKASAPKRVPGALVGGIVAALLGILLAGLYAASKPPPMQPLEAIEGAPPITALRIRLPDGRQVAYREQGAPADEAKHTLIVQHGLYSSRLAGLLRNHSVRLIAFDRPGFGQSDPHANRSLLSSAHDMAEIADALHVPHKFWVLGTSGGGPHAWAAARYIPERLAGVAMWAPVGSPYWPDANATERRWFVDMAWPQKATWVLGRRAPWLLPHYLQLAVVPRVRSLLKNIRNTVGEKDRALLDQEWFVEELERNADEALRQNSSWPAAQEYAMIARDWGFKLHELQGTDDYTVPPEVNVYAKRVLPSVNLHLLDGEGHFSWFCHCDKCHRELLETLFGAQP
eukprot:jgi/Mesen1/790/ME000110S_11057